MTEQEFKAVTIPKISAMTNEEYQEYLQARDEYYTKHPFACRHCVYCKNKGGFYSDMEHKWLKDEWVCRKHNDAKIDIHDPSCEDLKRWRSVAW